MVYPLNWLLNRATSLILSFFKVAEASHAEVYTDEEIKGLVATSKEHGEMQHDKADMLNNLFEFDQRQVGRVMIPRSAVHVLDVAAEPEAIIEIIKNTEHSRFPVIDSANNDEVVGIILVKDIYRSLLSGEQAPWARLREYCREPMYVPETQKISNLFEIMRSKRVHMALVVDEYGEFVGVVTLEDLLEEIVGEIHDETDGDHHSDDIVQINENQWEVDGLASLTDVNRETGMQVPDELDANTVSGLFMQRLARMPQSGDEIREQDYLLRVVSIVDQRVGKTLIIKDPVGESLTEE